MAKKKFHGTSSWGSSGQGNYCDMPSEVKIARYPERHTLDEMAPMPSLEYLDEWDKKQIGELKGQMKKTGY